MDDMEREALRRAEKMRGAFRSQQNAHRETKFYGSQSAAPPKSREESLSGTVPGDIPKEEPDNSPVNQRCNTEESKGEDYSMGMFDSLLKDKEATLILMLIFVLYEDNADPMLMMALVYLLIT